MRQEVENNTVAGKEFFKPVKSFEADFKQAWGDIMAAARECAEKIGQTGPYTVVETKEDVGYKYKRVISAKEYQEYCEWKSGRR